MVSNRTRTLNFAIQAAKIKALFPDSSPTSNHNRLVWNHTITPSPLSASYDVKLVYVRDDWPKVYVVNPKLELYPGEVALPHVYSTEEQWLCLYYRPGREWKADMHLADTIIPWTCEWLLHYELWLATGNWHGGGIHPKTELNKLREIHSRNEHE